MYAVKLPGYSKLSIIGSLQVILKIGMLKNNLKIKNQENRRGLTTGGADNSKSQVAPIVLRRKSAQVAGAQSMYKTYKNLR